MKRINLNPAVQGNWIQLRAQAREFQKIEPLFEGLVINSYPLDRTLREGLDNIFDLQEDEVMGEKVLENITEFYGNENLAQKLYSEWMRQMKIAGQVDHLVRSPSQFKAYFFALLLMFSKLWVVFLAIYAQFTVLNYEKIANAAEQRDYTNNLKDAAVIAHSALTVNFQMLEFRTKYLSIQFIFALALNLFFFVHIPELIGLMIHL